MNEDWRPISEFPNYQISNIGRVFNTRDNSVMRTSVNNHGHIKITLQDPRTKQRYTRSVALMVAEAFVEAPNWMCDNVVILDGDLTNVVSTNLVWRPRWYAWKYTRQLRVRQPVHYQNLIVQNVSTEFYYNSIIEAGMLEGLLFEDIWRSTYTAAPLFPYGHIFKIVERV